MHKNTFSSFNWKFIKIHAKLINQPISEKNLDTSCIFFLIVFFFWSIVEKLFFLILFFKHLHLWVSHSILAFIHADSLVFMFLRSLLTEWVVCIALKRIRPKWIVWWQWRWRGSETVEGWFAQILTACLERVAVLRMFCKSQRIWAFTWIKWTQAFCCLWTKWVRWRWGILLKHVLSWLIERVDRRRRRSEWTCKDIVIGFLLEYRVWSIHILMGVTLV